MPATRQARERTVPTIFVVDDENNVRSLAPLIRVLGMTLKPSRPPASSWDANAQTVDREQAKHIWSANHVEAFPSATAPPGACSNPLAAGSHHRRACVHPLRRPDLCRHSTAVPPDAAA